MLGNLILLALTWMLLWREQKSLSHIGLNHLPQRSVELAAGFVFAGFFVFLQFVLLAHFAQFDWKINVNYSITDFGRSTFWVFNSVLFEELIFRGYLLYKLSEWLGEKRACLISAASFGIYHWFSYGVLGEWITMIYVFILTASSGLLFAYAFAKSSSIILPIALHLGWNLMTIVVFSNGPLGEQLLLAEPASSPMTHWSQQIVISILIPLSYIVIGLWFLRRKYSLLPKQVV